jgi:hypothetical protein
LLQNDYNIGKGVEAKVGRGSGSLRVEEFGVLRVKEFRSSGWQAASAKKERMKSGWPSGSRRYIQLRENREHSALAGIVQDTSFGDPAEPFGAQGQFFGMQGKPLGA